MGVADKTIIGLTEMVTAIGKKSKRVRARIDTGATVSSIDSKLAMSVGINEIIRTKKVKNANGITERPVVKCIITLKGKRYLTEATLADRKNMKYPILIGQNTLRKGNFLVDPMKK